MPDLKKKNRHFPNWSDLQLQKKHSKQWSEGEYDQKWKNLLIILFLVPDHLKVVVRKIVDPNT